MGVFARVLLLTVMFSVFFFPAAGHARPSDPGKLVLAVSNQVLDLVRDARKMEEGKEAFLNKELKTTLDPYIDFATFARGVMGKYRDEVSQENTERFVKDFKSTLVRLYGKSMLAFEVEDITIAETVTPRPAMAQVTMHITSEEGASFKAQYSLRQNKQDEWKVLNVILDGVNLGLTYRNQFYSAVDSNDGDVAAAISNWSSVMKDAQTEVEKDIGKEK